MDCRHRNYATDTHYLTGFGQPIPYGTHIRYMTIYGPLEALLLSATNKEGFAGERRVDCLIQKDNGNLHTLRGAHIFSVSSTIEDDEPYYRSFLDNPFYCCESGC